MNNTSTPEKWYKKPIIIIPIVILIAWWLLPRLVDLGTSIMSLVSLLFSYLVWIIPIAGLIWLINQTRKNSKAAKASAILKAQEPQKNFWKQLGSSVEEREKNIKQIFYSKDASINYGDSYHFKGWNGQAHVNSSLTFCISRNLAAMEPREREFLKIALLLYNTGKVNDFGFNYYLFAFLNGNGKAYIENYSYKNIFENFSDAPGMVKFYQDKWDASVDSAINSLLQLMDDKDKRTIRGGGAWLTEDEIEGTIFNGSSNYQLNLGHIEDSKIVLHYSGEGSLITIAPPGSGKTQCFVIPNMLNWQGAAVVLDIKGEIYATTHKWREKNIGRVFKFSPLDPNNSHSYNPLVFVRKDADYIWEDSRFLADMMIVPSGASDPFWENMARDVLTAAITYVSFNNEPEDRPMSKVLDIIYGIGWDEMITSLKTNVFVSAMRQTGHALGEMERKQRDSILKTAQSSLSAWQGERIAKVTKKSDWSPLDLRNGSPTIYICINPNEIDSYLSVLRVLIAQHIRMLTTELPQRGAAPVLFMLDELPRLKKMPPVDEALNIGRQYGIKLWMFAQSYGQLKEAYPNPEGLLGSCVVRTFMNLPLNDELTTKISDQLGYREGPLDTSKQKLVEPLELAGPNYRDIILVLATNTKPAKVRKKFAYEDSELIDRMN